jgi:MOSC domain-containing protein YiiM
MVRRFLASGRTGCYFAVTREGDVGAGDAITIVARDPDAVPVAEITRLFVAKTWSTDDAGSAERAVRVAAFPESWKELFRERLQNQPCRR